MKTNIEIKNRNHFLLGRSLANACIKVKKIIGIFVYLIIFTGSGMLLNSCVGGYGYVASEPNYELNYARPERPAEGYIWIDGDWLWDNSSRSYIHERGYWTKPRNGRTYEAGRWDSRPAGKLWIKGRWTKENEKSASRNKVNERNRNEHSSPSDHDSHHD